MREGDSIPIFQGLQGLEALSRCRFASPSPPAPAAASSTYPDFAEITKTEPEKSLVEGLKKSGGRNAHGRKTSRHRGGGAKRLYRKDRLQAPQGRHPGQGRRDRVRPEPLGLHRAAALRRRREGLHPRPGAPARRRRRVMSGPSAEIAVGNCLPLASIPTGTVVHNVELAARPRRPARPLRRHVDPAHGQGRRHGHAAPALGRDAHGARRVPRDRRHDRQRRSPERQGRQGRPQAPHGRAPADARHGDEPGRPPARRRRGLDHRRAATRSRPWGVPTLGYRTRKKNKASDRYIVRGRRRGKGKR